MSDINSAQILCVLFRQHSWCIYYTWYVAVTGEISLVVYATRPMRPVYTQISLRIHIV